MQQRMAANPTDGSARGLNHRPLPRRGWRVYRPGTWWTGVRGHGGHFLLFEIVIVNLPCVKR
jgi:hypothetical protein